MPSGNPLDKLTEYFQPAGSVSSFAVGGGAGLGGGTTGPFSAGDLLQDINSIIKLKLVKRRIAAHMVLLSVKCIMMRYEFIGKKIELGM
jgi:hypothetical protein